MLASEAYWRSLPLGYVGIYKRYLDGLTFYGRDGAKWRLRSISPNEPVGMFRRFFRALEPVSVSTEIEPAGHFTADELRAALRAAVEADDDILCQYHAKTEILTWLEKAPSIAKIFNLYGWITKASVRGKGTASDGDQSVAPN